MIRREISRVKSRLKVKKNQWVYLPVNKTIDQHRKGNFILFLLLIGSLLAIMLAGHLIINIKTFVLFPRKGTEQINRNYIFIKVVMPLIVFTIIFNCVWFLLHTTYSPIKNYRLKHLLRHASSELDLLRYHHSINNEEPVRGIEWRFKYDLNENLIIKLLPGGHITKDKAEDVSRQLTNFLILKTKNTQEWNLVNFQIDDEEGTILLTYGERRERLIIDSLESITVKDDCIQLDSEFYFDPKKQVHLIAVGRTGSGKTTFVKILILAILSEKKNRIYMCDGKASYLSTLDTLSTKIKVATKGSDLLEMLEEIVEIIEKRYERLNNQFEEEKDLTYVEAYPNEGLVYFIFDEVLALFTLVEAEDKLKKPKERLLPKIQAAFTNILQLGRAANVHVILTGQQINHTIISTSNRESFGARLVLGRVDPANAIEILNVGKSSLPNIDTSNYNSLIWLDGHGWETAKPMLLPTLDEDKLPFKSTVRTLSEE